MKIRINSNNTRFRMLHCILRERQLVNLFVCTQKILYTTVAILHLCFSYTVRNLKVRFGSYHRGYGNNLPLLSELSKNALFHQRKVFLFVPVIIHPSYRFLLLPVYVYLGFGTCLNKPFENTCLHSMNHSCFFIFLILK